MTICETKNVTTVYIDEIKQIQVEFMSLRFRLMDEYISKNELVAINNNIDSVYGFIISGIDTAKNKSIKK